MISIAIAGIVLRCGLAFVVLFAGMDKLLHWRESLDEVNGLGLPFPALFSAATIVTQLVGGLMVATGYGAALGALALGGFTVMATILGHRFWLLRGQPARREFTTALEHLAITSGLLLLALGDIAA
jgi:putative oxidoreductase